MNLLFQLVVVCAFCFSVQVNATEVFNSSLESPTLKNVQQLTFPSMGFEKAGEAYFSPDGNSIVFQAVPEGQQQYQIYTMRLDEGIPRMVSTGSGACTCAYFRPDGKKIIFASSHSDPFLNRDQSVPGYKREGKDYAWAFTPYMNIYEANPDGSALRPLTQGPAYSAECAYSSDGSRIVFASNRLGSMNIFTMNSEGGDIQAVTNTTRGYNGGPFFSPDGKKIIFRADYDKAHYLQVYSINTDGTNLQQLTKNDAVNWAPYWHPDGIVFAYTTSLHGHMHYEIYLQNVSTGAIYRMTHNESFDGLPVFSNDGSKVMWTSRRGPDKTCQIFIADFTMPETLK